MDRQFFDGEAGWATVVGLDPSLAQIFYVTMQSYVNADMVLRSAAKRKMSPEKMIALLRSQGVDTGRLEAAMSGGSAAPAAPNSQRVSREARLAELHKKHHPTANDVEVVQSTESVKEPAGPTKKNLLGRLLAWMRGKKDELEAMEPTEKTSRKKVWLIGGGTLALVTLALIGYFMFAGGGSTQNQYDFSDPNYTFVDPSIPTGPTSLEFATQTPSEGVVPNLLVVPQPAPVDPDVSFWSSLKHLGVPELSPGNMGGQLTANTAVGLFLLLMLTLESFGEGKIRKKGQNGALFFTIVALLTGWFTMPILVLMSSGVSAGWFMIWSIVLGVLWAMTASTILSQNDLSPTTVALAIFTASLFYYGKLVIIAAIGVLFGAVWPVWVGVTTVGGAVTLLMSGRASLAILTIVIDLLGVLVIYLASIEVGKKHGHWSALMVGAAIITIFALSNWGLNSLILYLVTTQNLSITATVIFKVIAPILSWLFSLVGAIGFGVALGDVEVGRAENRQTLGLEKTGTFIQNIADFLILGTIIPLFLGVIVVLF